MDIPNAPACRVLLAALGPRMLRLCGSRTAGTITWMTGPRTLAAHVVPGIRDAAAAADRPPPRIVALVAVQVTDSEGEGRVQAGKTLRRYGDLPSYRAMLDREGLARPEDFAIIGNEADVAEQISAYKAAGATDMGVAVLGGPEYRDRTRALIASLAGHSKQTVPTA
jgi:alkanesulfonate monooxygenase SsuD/methylene tetrahydromethanopterin reductase-like flavin-dependent oxidoreductase (luciferase family)